jgi:hypothetical protein
LRRKGQQIEPCQKTSDLTTKHIVSGMKKNTAALLELVEAAAAAQKQNDDENSLLKSQSGHPDIVVDFTDKAKVNVTDEAL